MFCFTNVSSYHPGSSQCLVQNTLIQLLALFSVSHVCAWFILTQSTGFNTFLRSAHITEMCGMCSLTASLAIL